MRCVLLFIPLICGIAQGQHGLIKQAEPRSPSSPDTALRQISLFCSFMHVGTARCHILVVAHPEQARSSATLPQLLTVSGIKDRGQDPQNRVGAFGRTGIQACVSPSAKVAGRLTPEAVYAEHPKISALNSHHSSCAAVLELTASNALRRCCLRHQQGTAISTAPIHLTTELFWLSNPETSVFFLCCLGTAAEPLFPLPVKIHVGDHEIRARHKTFHHLAAQVCQWSLPSASHPCRAFFCKGVGC